MVEQGGTARVTTVLHRRGRRAATPRHRHGGLLLRRLGLPQVQHAVYGVTVWEGFGADDRGTCYRWHIPDPVRFHKSLKVTIEHKGSRQSSRRHELHRF